MKTNITKLILVIISFCIYATVNAQNKHEFSVFSGGGLSTLKYTASEGKQKMSIGGLLGLSYQFFFSQNLSIGTGMEFALYNSTFKLKNLSTRYMTTDIDNDNFEFRTVVSNYEEKQDIAMIQIPIMLQIQSGNKHKFYIAAGGKIGINLNGNYSSKSASIVNTGYYDCEDYEHTTQKFIGFGTFADKKAKGNLDFKTAFFASAEIGMKWKIGENSSLYTGAYLDYGLNNISKIETLSNTYPQFIEYNTAHPRDFAINSILKSKYTQNGTVHSFTNKIKPFATGIKLKLAFGKNGSKSTM